MYTLLYIDQQFTGKLAKFNYHVMTYMMCCSFLLHRNRWLETPQGHSPTMRLKHRIANWPPMQPEQSSSKHTQTANMNK